MVEAVASAVRGVEPEMVVNLLDLTVPPLSRMYCLGECGKLLWHPDSRELGYGRECAERLGITGPGSPRFSRRDGGDCDGQQDLTDLLEEI